MDAEKLAKMQASVRTGGKGTMRRKKKVVHKSGGGDDKKLAASLKRLQCNPIPGFEEANMFLENGNVLHFKNPKVQANLQSKIISISGTGTEKAIPELLPGILQHLDPENLQALRQMAASMQAQNAAAGGTGIVADGADDDVPELVENFDEAARQ